MAYGTTVEVMIEAAGIDDLDEAIRFAEWLPRPDILGGRYTVALAAEIVAEWRLNRILGEATCANAQPRPRVDWAKDGF